MRMGKRTAAIVASTLITVLLQPHVESQAPEGTAIASRVRAPMEFLADDLLEGREAG